MPEVEFSKYGANIRRVVKFNMTAF